MIEGVRIEITSDELWQHLVKRETYHREKEAWYRGQVESLMKGGVGPTGASNNPIESLERSRQEHESKMQLFEFMAGHVIPKEVYRLSESDLARIEIISRYI